MVWAEEGVEVGKAMISTARLTNAINNSNDMHAIGLIGLRRERGRDFEVHLDKGESVEPVEEGREDE